jgi:hypothetical protein
MNDGYLFYVIYGVISYLIINRIIPLPDFQANFEILKLYNKRRRNGTSTLLNLIAVEEIVELPISYQTYDLIFMHIIVAKIYHLEIYWMGCIGKYFHLFSRKRN